MKFQASLPPNTALPSLLARMRRYLTCFARSSESDRSQGQAGARSSTDPLGRGSLHHAAAISALARVPRNMRCRLAPVAYVPVITSLPAAQEARMPDTRVEEKRGAGIIVEAMERNRDGTITGMVLRRLPSGFPATPRRSDVIPAI